MEKNNNLPIKIIHAVLLVASMVFCFIGYTGAEMEEYFSQSFLPNLIGIFNFFVVIIGFVYLVYGYKKNGAVFYKAVMWIFLIAQFIALAITFDFANNIYTSDVLRVFIGFLYILAYTFTVILTVGKDLGKKTSILLAIGLLVCKAIILVSDLIIGEYSLTVSVTNDIVSVLLSGSVLLMVCGKYADKTARGTK